MYDDFDDYEDDQPVKRIKSNVQGLPTLGKQILNQAQDYLDQISQGEHTFLINHLHELAQQDEYFNVLADQLDQPVGAKVANDALNLMHFWPQIHQFENIEQFNLLDLINTEFFQTEMLNAFDALDLNQDLKAKRRPILLESFKMYKLGVYSGCIPNIYAQLEGILTDVLLKTGFLKQNGTKFVDVYKIVPGLKGNEIKSLWHKSKIATEMNPYFAELAAYKMDSSSTVTMTRHNMLHGTDIDHFNQARSFILFIWLFSAVSFMSTVRV
ncbi:hypothetical protein A3K93_09155 [Acinetobacter sp. NCu2D-2]|uniref:hypothetical protein n=1 Tax=Acinetobacter sp. NCu2D-2 TaxID=1608473 RepID=UPI0007CE00C7|nr:hypothetical protein [Acinetobacter sp. NCu2D-2]ANF82341.1 hypothetical protein A3K93_09155 [Acinetobacter sp. NCu2D-2]